MIIGIHHHAIKVRDLPACERFYREVLGLALIRRWPAPSGVGDRSVWLDTGAGDGGFLAIEAIEAIGGAAVADPRAGDQSAARDAEQPGHHLVALRIAREQRAAWEARLAAAGVPISHRTAFTIYFADPEGNRLGLSHHPDPALAADLATPMKIPPAGPR
jgi:catechol 2,3-dioxygenase-like lactoylglutathione lyase family enzyme